MKTDQEEDLQVDLVNQTTRVPSAVHLDTLTTRVAVIEVNAGTDIDLIRDLETTKAAMRVSLQEPLQEDDDTEEDIAVKDQNRMISLSILSLSGWRYRSISSSLH